ncbi:MAG: TonB C-terminal domain-containing protein [Aliarcobacter sp.]|nr:TonB C-terminal domain-containing protein [Aliarcobacter sp.]
MQNNFSFILSGIIAFSFYIFICVLIMFYLFSPVPKTLDLKSTSMTIELDMITEKAEKKMVEKKTEKIIEKEAVKEKEASVSNEKKPDLKSLFANVKETAKTVTKEEVNNIEKSIDPKRFKAKLEKEKRSNNIKIDKLLEDEKTATNAKSTNANKGQETDEYFSKVQELLDVWNPVGTGLKAVVLIMIDLDGRFDYRIVTGSGDEGFDSSLKAFLEEQKNLAYPKPTKDKDIKVNVNFRSEG